MTKSRRREWILYGVLILMLVWLLGQLMSGGGSRSAEDPVRLLHQVAVFQLELLQSFSMEAGRADSTRQLHSLKQAAYSMQYTHDRLAMAVGRDNLPPLGSMQQLMQAIIRMEIGGARPLRRDELELLHQASEAIKSMYGAYSQLLSSRGTVVASRRDALMKEDRSLEELLRRKQLE